MSNNFDAIALGTIALTASGKGCEISLETTVALILDPWSRSFNPILNYGSFIDKHRTDNVIVDYPMVSVCLGMRVPSN